MVVLAFISTIFGHPGTFCNENYWLKVVNYFHKTPFEMFHEILNKPLFIVAEYWIVLKQMGPLTLS